MKEFGLIKDIDIYYYFLEINVTSEVYQFKRIENKINT
jgi:hypothetical protein